MIHKFPSQTPCISFPSLSKINGSTPKNGKVADPGFRGVNPEIGDIRMKMLYPPDHWLHSAEYYIPSMSKRFERDWVWAPGGGAIMKDWLRTQD